MSSLDTVIPLKRVKRVQFGILSPEEIVSLKSGRTVQCLVYFPPILNGHCEVTRGNAGEKETCSTRGIWGYFHPKPQYFV